MKIANNRKSEAKNFIPLRNAKQLDEKILPTVFGAEHEEPNITCPDCHSPYIWITPDFWGYSCICMKCGKAFHFPPYPWE